MKKAQIVSADFVPSLFLFLGIFVGVIVSWNTTVNQIEDVNARNAMERAALGASDLLVRHEGNPSNWTFTNVIVPGLSDGPPNVLSESKAYELLFLDYTRAKELLGIPYEFYIEINKTLGTAFVVNGNETVYGLRPSGANSTVVVRRFVMMGGKTGTLEVRVWS